MLGFLRGYIASNDSHKPFLREESPVFRDPQVGELRAKVTSHQVKTRPDVVNLEVMEDDTLQIPDIYYPTPVRRNGPGASPTYAR